MLDHESNQDRKEFVHPFEKGPMAGMGDHDEFALGMFSWISFMDRCETTIS